MSHKYFTGNGLDAHRVKASGDVKTYPTSRAGGLTAPTLWWVPETPPVAGADGIDRKGHAALSKYEAVIAKVHSTSAANVTKTRGNACIGKYELGKMWKYRKTLKKLHTAAGHAVGAAVGERNMFTTKGNGNTGATARPKNFQQTPLADSYELFPIDAGK